MPQPYIVAVHLGWLHLKARRFSQLGPSLHPGGACKVWWFEEIPTPSAQNFHVEAKTKSQPSKWSWWVNPHPFYLTEVARGGLTINPKLPLINELYRALYQDRYVCLTNFIRRSASNPKCHVTFSKTKMNVNWHNIHFILKCQYFRKTNVLNNQKYKLDL